MLKTTDVVSIDLFDTLIMRKVLLPSDVIELVNYKMEEQGIFIDKFCEKRLQCEKELAKQTAPTLEEIYYYMREKFPYEGITPKQLAHLEWLIDYDLVLPRKEMCELIAGVYKQGKKSIYCFGYILHKRTTNENVREMPNDLFYGYFGIV